MPVNWQFSSALTNGSPCRVLAFNAEDDILHGYAFDILIRVGGVSAREAPGFLADMIRTPLVAMTGKTAAGTEFSWSGMAASVSYLFSDENNSVFRVMLRPRFYRLWLNAHSRIFLHMPLPQILSKVLKEEGFTSGSDFENSLKGEYPSRPYTCQYNESSAAFLLRHLERAGGYAFVRQTADGDVLVLADAGLQPEALPVRDNLDWSEDHADETVFSLSRTKDAAPTKVTLRDYSTEQPGMTRKSLGDPQQLYGGGEVNLYAGCYFYGEVDAATQDFIVEKANAAADNLAKIHVRRLISRSNRAEGESSIPWLRAGYAVTIGQEDFQIISVRHTCTLAGDEIEERIVRRARQAGFVPGTAQGYRNSFVCHPLELCPYAPECATPRPFMPGLLHAQVDASGDGKYAELDQHGRYKVMFFFPEKVIHTDADDPAEGNRSIPLRMAQPHVGESSGIHFPLLKGAEVLVAFTDGDPDRPVIISAMPNPEHPSVVLDENQQSNMIQTPGGHKLNFNDTEGEENITMATPGGHSVVLHDEPGKREICLRSPCGGYIRLREK